MAEVSITVNIEASHEAAAHDSLMNWLANHRYVQKKVKFSQQTVKTESVAGAIALITLILENTLEIAKLTSVFTEWRRRNEDVAAPLFVQANKMTSVLSVDDMKDETIVRRALSGAPDPRKSQCVLIGVSNYTDLDDLPAVEQNLADLDKAITDPEIWGVPAERVHRIGDPLSGEDVRDAINAAAQEDSDTLLVYYAGHGLQDDTRGLLLTLPNASHDGTEGTIAWSDLASVINHAPSQRRVVVLDCCYGGLASEHEDTSSDLLKAAKDESSGTYILAAAHRNGEAWSPENEEHTAFTGELLQALRGGIKSGPDSQEFLTLNAICAAVHRSLTSKARPQPHKHDPDGVGRFPYLRNSSWRGKRAWTGWNLIPSTTSKPSTRDGIVLRIRSLLVLAGAAVIAVAAYFGVTAATGNDPGPTDGGLSLTEYCHSQHLTVDGNYCLSPISLKAACNWQYHVNNLNYKFTSKDPNSAICYNSSVVHNDGITQMSRYCQDSTGAPGAVATTSNPAYQGTWVCEEKINRNVACITQYNKPDLQARQDGDGNWWCYG